MIPIWLAMLGMAVACLFGGWASLRVAEKRRREDAAEEELERRAYVGTLATGLAHELRNPLSTLCLHIELLIEDWISPVTEREQASRKRLDGILREARRLESILNDFLQFAAEHRLREEPVAINALLRELGEFIAPRALTQGVDFTYEFAPDLPTFVGDPILLRHAFLNLVINAIEATPAGGLVHLRTAAEGSDIVVRVRDTGRGVAPELRDKIFQIYFSTKPAGTGLGLPTAKKIVSQHGGRIEVESEPGAGSTFIVRLPAEKSDGR